MTEFKPIPEALSHKQLSKLLTKAKKDVAKETVNLENNEASDKFKELATQWSKVSKKLLSDLDSKKNYLIKGKGPNSLMALGAMEVHLNMAIQALKASEQEE